MLKHVPGRDAEGEGEVCFRGRHVMMGYLDDTEKTVEVLDEDGWLHSGDIGSLDRLLTGGQVLRITGRAKELLITAGGENVAPVPIENALKQILPGISQAMVIGDKRKYLSCLITLHMKPDGDGFVDELVGASTEVDPEAKIVADAMNSPLWKEYITAGIREYNRKYSVSRAQNIQTFAILPMDFSVDGGELTPTQKLKRSVVSKKYSEVIEGALYNAESLAKNTFSAVNLQTMSA